MPYKEAWELQNQLAVEIALGERPPTLLLLEHPHTYTFGRSGKIKNLLWDEEELSHRNISVHWVDRGGDVTYHGPGQLVGYPLLPLGPAQMNPQPQGSAARILHADYIGYLRKIERALIAALKTFGISAVQYPGLTGVWIPLADGEAFNKTFDKAGPRPAKVAAIGVKVDARGVSRHGFALNVNPDMSYWEGIIACGLNGFAETSLGELLAEAPKMDRMMDIVTDAFGIEFDYSMQTRPL